ncbi:MAG: hypothetical protein WD000_10965 [Thermodesulfobacteriota bacterium]
MENYNRYKIKNSSSFFLFARPSFLEGVARIFDFGNTLNNYNVSRTSEESDIKAIKRDWITIGYDMGGAILTCKSRHPDKHFDDKQVQRKPATESGVSCTTD